MRNKCLLNLLTIYGLITALSVTNGESFSIIFYVNLWKMLQLII